MTENHITYDEHGNAVSFAGPRGTAVFHAAALAAGLGLWAKGIKPHRSWTSLRAALQVATSYTGQRYAGRKDIERARADLHEFVQRVKAELAAQ